MPSGKTHEKVNNRFLFWLFFFFFIGLGYTWQGMDGLLISFLFCTGYAFGTYYFGPDLDLKSRSYYRWKFLRFIWIPYQKWFHHRSIWTHGILLGDFIRFVYLGCVFFPFYWLFCFVDTHFSWGYQVQLEALLTEHLLPLRALVTGIVLASTLHIATDIIVTLFTRNRIGKNHRKRKKKRKA